MLVSFTGLDGCGKGTQIDFLSRYLEQKKVPVHLSKAYGNAEKEIFAKYIENVDQVTILFLFQALHREQYLRASNALSNGLFVIADRWDDSYLAYHEQFGQLSHDNVLRDRLNRMSFESLAPDVTFYLRVPAKEAKKRTEARGADFFDRKGEDYHSAMMTKYEELAVRKGWIILDGGMPPHKIHERVVEILGV